MGIDVVVIGNTTLDVLCYYVDDVPRHDSLVFDRALVCPGGCGSNVAIGLCALQVPTALVTTIGVDDAYAIVERYWQRAGLDCRYVRRTFGALPAISVGLVDIDCQPRFVHTPGANCLLQSSDLDVDSYVEQGARALMVAGFFVLPGLLDGLLPSVLSTAQTRGLITFLDVANIKCMDRPEHLWACLPYLDYFVCNTPEASRLTIEEDPRAAACSLRRRGAKTVIVKLGGDGCWVDSDIWSGRVPGVSVDVVDTTGAGDAFAAGLIASTLDRKSLPDACLAGNEAGARIVRTYGAISAWMEEFGGSPELT